MKKNLVTKIIILVVFSFCNLSIALAQCTFTGLNPTYCINSAASTLSPGISGGTFSGNGVSGTTFNPAVAGPGTWTVNYATCSTSYAITSPSFAPSSTVGTSVALGDDQESGILPIGFTFNFFCTPYTNFYISSNGFIEFSLTGNGCCSGQALPNNGTPNNLIAGAWIDLHPGNGGTITYSTVGTAPNRILLVSFVGVPYYVNTLGVTFQIKLFETSNIIEIHSTSINNPNSGTQTMGIENVGGTIGFPAPGRNAQSWTATNDCYRWTPGTVCSVTQTTTVFPTTITVVGNSSICVGATSSITATGNTTYTWSTNSNAANITVTPTVSTTYSVSGTNAFGCIASSAITVTVDNTPTVTTSNSNGTSGSCPNTPLTLSGNGATSYTWTGGITNGIAFTPTTSATYSVTGANACGSETAAISVSIHPIPPVTASVNNLIICSGNSAILNGGGAVSYTWTPSVGNNVAFFPVSTQNYTVTGTSALGCTASAVQGVTVITTPSITPVVTPTAVCLGVTATLSATGATGYTWTPGTNLTAATVTVSPPGPTTYTLFRTNGICSNTSTVNLVIFPLPFVNASATPSQICAGTGVSLLAFGAITYTWLPGGFSAASFSVFPNFSNTYTVTGSNGNCTTSVVVPVIVNPSPVISITASSPTMCVGQSVNLIANGAGALTYTWSPGGSNSTSITVSPNVISSINLSATNASNCVSSANQLIIVYPVPNMSLTTSLPFVCANQSAIVSIANPSTTVVYNWSTGATGVSIQANPAVTTTYFATGTDTTTGCQNTNTITLPVYISTLTVSSPTALCKGQTATLTASGPATSYIWTTSNGATIGASASLTVSPLSTTLYSVTGSNVSCSSTQGVNLIVNPLPNVTAVTAKSYICRFEVSSITGGGALYYNWNTGATTPTISFNLSLTTSYTLTGTDINGCSKTTTVTQFVATCPGFESRTINDNLSVTIFPNPNSGNFVINSDVNISLQIVNTLGQVVHTLSLNEGNNNNIAVNNLPNGIYFITGETKGIKVNKKIVIER
jgi:hypothetical protein